MIFSDFYKAIAQLGDPRFLRVALFGVGLCLLLLAAVFALFLWAIQAFVPDSVTLPLIGPVGGIDTALGIGLALLMILLSVFLMVPVASAFSGLFLEQVVDAVEDRHYPAALPVPGIGFLDGLRDAAGFLGVMIVVNLLALVLYLLLGPLAPLIFWAVNGFLLGREYFTLVALRRLGRTGAAELRQRHFWQIWVAGTLMAIPLSLPLVNLLIPVLGVASFTHMFHRLTRTAA